MQLFYAPNIEHELKLPNDEFIHCTKVLRKKEGDIIHVIDGKGNLFNCEIQGQKLLIKNKTTDFGKRKNHIHIAVAPTKNIDRYEWFIEKATEIGIDEITPILCEKSERKTIKTERLEKKAISAMKQSLTGFFPKINELTKFSLFVKQNFESEKYIAHLSNNSKEFNSMHKTKNQIILIGPEGDFSNNELQLALKNNFQEISLGNKRLRTETAAIYALILANL